MLDFPKNGKVTVNNGNQTIRPFGAFEADLPSGEVRKSGSRIKLQDQPFKVLQILLEHPRDLVTERSCSPVSGRKTVLETSITQ